MTDGNDQAYPTEGFTYPNGDCEWPTPGLTKREAFAMAAMQSGRCPHNSHDHEQSSAWCITEADALIAALNGGEG